MIVEPVPTGPRSRPRRAAARVALVVPGALLVLVVAAGMLGPATSRSPLAAAGSPGAPSPGASDGSLVMGAATPQAPHADPGPVAARETPFPVTIDGLPVRAVSDVLAARVAGNPQGIVAVAGYLGVLLPPTDCGDTSLGPLGPLCLRRALLAQDHWSLVGSEGVSGIGPHLHARVPVGVRLPAAIARTTMAASGSPLRVVAIGRFDPLPASGCSAATVRCDEGFELDGVAWAEGAPFPPRPVVDPGVDANPVEWMLRHQRLAEGTLGAGVTLLASALLRPSTLASIDPAAAAAARGVPDGLVWYVRGLDTGHEPTPHAPDLATSWLIWVVVDDVSGTVLARGATGGGDSGAVP